MDIRRLVEIVLLKLMPFHMSSNTWRGVYFRLDTLYDVYGFLRIVMMIFFMFQGRMCECTCVEDSFMTNPTCHSRTVDGVVMTKMVSGGWRCFIASYNLRELQSHCYTVLNSY